MKAGFARRVITPGTPMTLAGFDRRTAPAEGALEDLYVSVLALEDESGGRFLLCSFDLLGTDRALCKAVREGDSSRSHQLGIWSWIPIGVASAADHHAKEYSGTPV